MLNDHIRKVEIFTVVCTKLSVEETVINCVLNFGSAIEKWSWNSELKSTTGCRRCFTEACRGLALVFCTFIASRIRLCGSSLPCQYISSFITHLLIYCKHCTHMVCKSPADKCKKCEIGRNVSKVNTADGKH